MPDLDQIKQVEQGVRRRQVRAGQGTRGDTQAGSEHHRGP